MINTAIRIQYRMVIEPAVTERSDALSLSKCRTIEVSNHRNMASYFHIRVDTDAFHYNRTIANHHGIGNRGILTDSIRTLFRQSE